MDKKIKILIADNNKAFIDLFKIMLNFDDAIMVAGEAHNGYHTIEMLANNSFDVLLLDIFLPDINGLEILRKINDLNLKTKVVIMTFITSEKVVYEALSIRALYYFCKPFDCNKLISTIKSLY